MLELIFQVGTGLAVIAVGLLAGYGAAAFAGTDLRAWFGYFASAAWPTAAGRITHAAITTIRTARSIRYQPEVRYTFDVAGQTYTGDRLTFSSWTEALMPAEAEQALRAYPLGGAVTVRYDPGHPQNSVLERRRPGGVIASCGIVCLLTGTSLLCLLTGVLGLAAGR